MISFSITDILHHYPIGFKPQYLLKHDKIASLLILLCKKVIKMI